MKAVWRHILAWTVVISLLVGLIISMQLIRRAAPTVLCDSCLIEITDSAERQLVTTPEINRLLHRKQVYPVGLERQAIPTQRIEQLLKDHPMVRTAQCYTTPQGTCHIIITQRIPLLKVQNEENCYYVDTDRRCMVYNPEHKAPVLLATGKITPVLACSQLSEIAEYIYANAYWKDRIYALHVNSDGSLILKQRHNAQLLIGQPEHYRRNLNKVQHFYQTLSWPPDSVPYKEIDVRFKGQVVGRK